MNDYLYEVAKRLVAFDTVSAKSDRDAMDYLAAELAPRGFKTAIQPIELFGVAQANLVAWIGPPRADGLIISGHVDVVPFDGQPGWEREPLKLELAGDRIYGRGTTDMKGFIAQCLDAARTLDSSRLKRPLVFVFTASEEVGCLGAHSVAPALKQILGETPVPQLAWIGEPTSWEVSHAHKSIVSFGVTVARHRRSQRRAGPRRQRDRRDESRNRHDRPLSAGARGAPTRQICGDFSRRAVRRAEFRNDPRRHRAQHDRRGMHACASATARCPTPIRSTFITRFSAGSPRSTATTTPAASIARKSKPTLLNVVPPLDSARGTALEAALFDVTGAKTAGGALYATDGGWFTGSGITSLICGPGDLDQAHQPNEHIRRDPFERGPAMIHKVIDRLCCT